jgi:L-2,4-diaminobutyrate decarboxylase
VLFSDPSMQEAISFGGTYLAVPNVGVQGSRSAAGVALLGTLLAWGSEGIAERIERLVTLSEELASRLEQYPRCILLQAPETGVVNWRPATEDLETVISRLGQTASRTAIDGEAYVRHVAANMYADIDAIWARITAALSG